MRFNRGQVILNHNGRDVQAQCPNEGLIPIQDLGQNILCIV